MGGSNSGGWNRLGDIQSLEQKARQVLSQNGQRNVFISFDTDDMDEVNLLRGQAKNDNNDIEFKDYSVKDSINSENADYIKQKITERIERSSTCVVYLSENTRNSDWVEWEVGRCIELGKQLIGTYKGDTPPKNLPKWVSNYKVELIPWSQLSYKLT